jgi:Protein of unknown function (DUF3305)
MPTLAMDVGIIIEKRKAQSQWIDVIWEACAVLPEAAGAEPGTSLGKTGDSERFYAGSATLEAHTYETVQYRDNLSSDKPQLWVVLRPRGDDVLPEVLQVTCDPTEGEGFTETGWDIVNVLPMPEPIQAALMAFVEEHHVERAFYKRKRSPADPEALAHGRNGPDRDRVVRALRDEQDIKGQKQ